MKKFFIFLILLAAIGCSDLRQADKLSKTQDSSVVIEKGNRQSLDTAIKTVEPFFKRMGQPGEGDWLASFPENGQTFAEYINSNPTLLSESRKTIYVQPIGTFSEKQREVIRLTAAGMEEFFGLPVKVANYRTLDDKLSPDDFRIKQNPKVRQIRSGYFLEKLLPPILPPDAAAIIAFTTEDLYPDPSMNYVFGQVNLENRVGVWSLYRLGDENDSNLLLKRTLKIATHETGHMFSMLHCTKYECGMSGSNSLEETDRYPLDFCPECMAKICWLTNYKPQERYKRLAEFFKKINFQEEAEKFEAKATLFSKD